MKKAIAFSAVSAIALAVSASASSAQTSEFSGFYLGIHGGYLDFDTDTPIRPEGGVIGAHAGYNYFFGPVLLGVEADFDWSDADYRQADTFLAITADVETAASLRGRLGWLATPNTLLFATAGYSWTELHSSTTLIGLGTRSKTTDADGAVVGGGVEYKFTQSFSGRLEGLHYWVQDSRGTIGETDVIRAGLSYHFK